MPDRRFAVLATKKISAEPLCQVDLPMGEVVKLVLRYETNQPVSIDGVGITKEELDEFKIVEQDDAFAKRFHDLHYFVPAPEYVAGLLAVFAEHGTDRTTSLISIHKDRWEGLLKLTGTQLDAALPAVIAALINDSTSELPG